jgi:hypothetical protein
MQELKIKKQDIIEGIQDLKELCKSVPDCKSCVGYQSNQSATKYHKSAEHSMGIRDFIGCPFTNHVIKIAEEYQEENGYDKAIDFSLIDLTRYNQIEAIMSEEHKPDKKNILSSLNQLETVLSDVIEERDEEIEKLPIEQEMYPVVSISRRASKLI